MRNKIAVTMAILTYSGFASAAIIPSGIQATVTNAQIANWGWSECSRSYASTVVSVAAVVSACQGDYLAMGVWNETRGTYRAVGMGAREVVTAITYRDYHGDNHGTIQNWSNGLNWYRTSSEGAWGFTTAKETALHQVDANLHNGMNDHSAANRSMYGVIGTNETTLAAGLSFYIDPSKNLNNLGYYNPNGNSFAGLSSHGLEQRVFWVANKSEGQVPEPTALGLMSLGIAGLATFRRRNKQT